MGSNTSIFRGGNDTNYLKYGYVLDEVGKRSQWVPKMTIRAVGWPIYAVADIQPVDYVPTTKLSYYESSNGIVYNYTYVGSNIISLEKTGKTEKPEKTKNQREKVYIITLVPVPQVKIGGLRDFNSIETEETEETI